MSSYEHSFGDFFYDLKKGGTDILKNFNASGGFKYEWLPLIAAGIAIPAALIIMTKKKKKIPILLQKVSS